MPLFLIFAIPFAIGLLLGSFLNVCIERLPKGESIATPRSRCPNCKGQIRWYDNIPLLSYVLLRRRCRECKETISIRYPLVELATGLWFALNIGPFLGNGFNHVYFHTPLVPISTFIVDYLVCITLGFLLLGLAVMDFRTQRLPDAFTITGIFIGLFLVCVQAVFLGPGEDAIKLHREIHLNSAGAGRSMGNVFLTGPEHLIFGRLLAVICAFLLLYGIRWTYRKVRHKDGMGLGDAKLLAMIAALLGFAPALVALFVGLLSATAAALYLLARGKADRMTRLPFGTFLCIGGFFAMLFGQQLIDWYSSLL